ncbi:hypothetical protein FRC00_004341 [Tulasnella sp. 408]|nr:hypothetical protein FRC00_004341 [Tulasnella sp. 408]
MTVDDHTICYGEIEFFTALRLAIFVKQTALMHDEAVRGPAATRVNSLLDRFISALAGIAALRYMQEYLGDATGRWHREERQKDSARREMWFSVGQLWSAAMTGLASALSQKRHDLFLFRGIDNLGLRVDRIGSDWMEVRWMKTVQEGDPDPDPKYPRIRGYP